MTLQRPWTGTPNPKPVAGSRPALADSTTMSELARVFITAQRDTGYSKRHVTTDASDDGFSELAQAVRTLVTAGRDDGSPPERILASIKSVTRPYFVHDVDAVRGDRLQALILREFLAAYYHVMTPPQPALRLGE